MTPITDAERERFLKETNGNSPNPGYELEHINETMRRLGIDPKEKPKTCTEIREQKVIGKEDLGKLVERLTRNDEQLKYMLIYRLIVEENKILHKDDMEDATRYFKRKGLYLDAAKIPETRGDQKLAKEIYTEGIKFYEEKGDNESAALAAMGAKAPIPDVRKRVERSKNVELLRQYMDYCSGIPLKQHT